MFNGFYPQTFEFLQKLAKNNKKIWFDKNRPKYEEFILKPATDFVLSIQEFFHFVNPAIVAEPKFNKSFVRINKDMRFAKKPYKDYFLIRFGRIKWESEFFLVINQNSIAFGLYINNEQKESIFKQNVDNNLNLISTYCEKYQVDKKYDIYELMKMEKTKSKFIPKEDLNGLMAVNHFLIRKDYSADKKINFSPKLFIEIIKSFNQLYPLYLSAISSDLKKDLKEYDNKIGLMEFKK